MSLIHCTKKLLKELGNPPLQHPDTSPDTQGLGNWYANLLRIDRRKCILGTDGEIGEYRMSPIFP
jgi:hypothetical protein